jgi:hypothetical protein
MAAIAGNEPNRIAAQVPNLWRECAPYEVFADCGRLQTSRRCGPWEWRFLTILAV